MKDRIEPMSLTGGAKGEPTDVITNIGNVATPEQGEFRPGRRLYLDKDGGVVEEGNPNKLSLLVSEHGSIPMARARELGLLAETEQKAIEAPPENKAVTMPKEMKKTGKKGSK